MPKFAANLTMLFNELPFLDRFEAAAEAGFTGRRISVPLRLRQDRAGCPARSAINLTQVLHNLPAGNWAGGERGIAILPDRVGEFRDGVSRAIDYAGTLGCTAGQLPRRHRAEGAEPRAPARDLRRQPRLRGAER